MPEVLKAKKSAEDYVKLIYFWFILQHCTDSIHRLSIFFATCVVKLVDRCCGINGIYNLM